jgi:small subunit ribosomal protein S14
MINKGIIENNKKRILLYEKYREIHDKYKKMLKTAMANQQIDESFRICQLLDKLPKNSSKTRIRNRCMITGRARGLVCYKLFPICAIKIREHANNGFLPGVYKI